jgi:hypothetical protein
MKPLLIFVLLLTTSQSTDQPYELKGEAPGMTLKQFKVNHKHTECSNPTARQTHCRVYDGVSFAGSAAWSFKGCTVPECSHQGIFADFVDDQLVTLAYGVPPFPDQVIAALKKKFGEPSESANGTVVWRNSVGYLSVGPDIGHGPNGAGLPLALRITSSLNDRGESKDI